jgi:DnaJ-class molecular chaperone
LPQVKIAFRELARRHHPDKAQGLTGDGGERFKRLRKAYEILSDTKTRQLFDSKKCIATKELANILEVDIGEQCKPSLRQACCVSY